jgi:hypothetical protein
METSSDLDGHGWQVMCGGRPGVACDHGHTAQQRRRGQQRVRQKNALLAGGRW